MALQASYYAGKSYYPADMMQRENDWISPGVLSALDLVATQTGTPSMAVTVTGSAQGQAGGNAWLPGGYRVYNDAGATIAVSAADSTNPRIDLLVACVDTTTNPYAPSIKVIKGTAAASPVVPTITAGLVALVLYKIAVAAGVTTIVNANLTDARVVAKLQIVPANILAALITADGAGSGLDADLLDGQQGSYYATAAANAAKAPLVSPVLTGIPTVPTAAVNTNTLQAANTAFVAAALAALVNASPAYLDTLNEFATAIGNDPNFSSTMLTLIGAKASQVDLNTTNTAAATHQADDVKHLTAIERTTWNAKLSSSDKGVANGLATLGSDGKHVSGQVPDVFKPGDVIAFISALSEYGGVLSYGSFSAAKQATVRSGGSVRVKFDGKIQNTSYVGYLRIYKNGVAVGIERTISSISFVTYTEDILNVLAGDVIQLYCKITNASSSVYAQNMSIGVLSIPTIS